MPQCLIGTLRAEVVAEHAQCTTDAGQRRADRLLSTPGLAHRHGAYVYPVQQACPCAEVADQLRRGLKGFTFRVRIGMMSM